MAADATLVTNVREVYKRTAAALKRREEGYEALFQSVQKHVSQRFMNYMMRRKHEVRAARDPGARLAGSGRRPAFSGASAPAARAAA